MYVHTASEELHASSEIVIIQCRTSADVVALMCEVKKSE